VNPFEFRNDPETRVLIGLSVGHYNRDANFISFDTIPGCDGQTDGQTDGQKSRSTVTTPALPLCYGVVKMGCMATRSETSALHALNQ